MCVVSFIGDAYKKHFDDNLWQPWRVAPYGDMPDNKTEPAPAVSKKDFDELKAKVEEMLEMLKAARAYDIATGQKDCQMEDKMEMLRRVCEVVGLDLTNIVFKDGESGNVIGDGAKPADL